MPRSRGNFERRTQWNTNRHPRSTGVAAMVVFSILTIGCGAEHSNDNQPTPTVDTGYSANHDSRINDDPGPRP